MWQGSRGTPAAPLDAGSVDGEAEGAVHFLPDEAGRAVLRAGPGGHPVGEQRALLGRCLGHLRLLQLPATHTHHTVTLQHPGTRVSTARQSKLPAAGHSPRLWVNFRSH